MLSFIQAAFSAYIGIGRNLFRLFPQLYDDPFIRSIYNRVANVEKLIYPRSLEKLSNRQLEVLEQQLLNDSVAVLESEMALRWTHDSNSEKLFPTQIRMCFWL